MRVSANATTCHATWTDSKQQCGKNTTSISFVKNRQRHYRTRRVAQNSSAGKNFHPHLFCVSLKFSLSNTPSIAVLAVLIINKHPFPSWCEFQLKSDVPSVSKRKASASSDQVHQHGPEALAISTISGAPPPQALHNGSCIARLRAHESSDCKALLRIEAAGSEHAASTLDCGRFVIKMPCQTIIW